MKQSGLPPPQNGCLFPIFNASEEDMAESEEELKSFLMKVKEESERVGLEVNIQKTQIGFREKFQSLVGNEQHIFLNILLKLLKKKVTVLLVNVEQGINEEGKILLWK